MSRYILPHEKRNQLTQLFIEFDYYSIGSIHHNSLFQIFKSMQIEIGESQILSLLEEVGNQNPTMVKLDEYLAIFNIISEDKELIKEIETIFRILDADKSKVINEDDIKKALKLLNIPYNQSEISNMLKISKKNSLTLQEFTEFVQRNS